MKFLALLLTFFAFALADENATLPLEDAGFDYSKRAEILKEIQAIDNALKNNVWITRYANYNTYQKLASELS
ncbi:MAG: mechanosensitive ion channel family protein, partial [Campylobacter sp.]